MRRQSGSAESIPRAPVTATWPHRTSGSRRTQLALGISITRRVFLSRASLRRCGARVSRAALSVPVSASVGNVERTTLRC